MLLIILIGIVGFSAGADITCSGNGTDVVLQEKSNWVNFSSTLGSSEKCRWKYNATGFDGFFLMLTAHNLTFEGNNTCIGDVRPTGRGEEMRTCSWKTPACYFFTKTKRTCVPDAIFQKSDECAYCESVTWAIKDDLHGSISFWSGTTAEENFTFYYEYLNCTAKASPFQIPSGANITDTPGTNPCYSGSSSSTVAETTASFMRNCKWTFISFVAAAFFASLSIILIVIMIIISKQNRRMKKVFYKSSKVVSRDDEICRSSVRKVSASVCNNETDSLTDSQDNIYDKLQLDDIATESSEKKTKDDPSEVTHVAIKSTSKGEKECVNEGKNGDDEPMYENAATVKITSGEENSDNTYDNLCLDFQSPTQKVCDPLDHGSINKLIQDQENKQAWTIEGARSKDSCQILNTEQKPQIQNAELAISNESVYDVAADDKCHVHATDNVKGSGMPGHNRLLLRHDNDEYVKHDPVRPDSSPSPTENYSVIKPDLAHSNSTHPTVDESLYDKIDRK